MNGLSEDTGWCGMRGSPALCVDVDGTLLRTDLLFESFLELVRQKPWLLPAVPLWLAKGKAYLKRQLAVHVSMESRHWCLHMELLQFLRIENGKGRRVVLCSASDRSLVQQIVAQLPFPVEVMASDGVVNLKGEAKAKALVDRFGLKGFDYAGNSKTDLPVWRDARHAVVVNASPQVCSSAKAQGNVTTVFPRSSNTAWAVLRALRPHQWVKNTLVFVPLITSHQFVYAHAVLKTAIAFAAMCLCASAVYVVNDLADLDSDRKHPTKRNRPFASGDLHILSGLALAPILFLGGLVVSLLLLSNMLTALLLSYVALSAVYTYWVKEKLLADVIMLAILYTVRIIVGGGAIGLLVSPWLLSFSLFLFVSLAFIKRVAEMIQISTHEQHRAAGRGYLVSDSTTLSMFGIASGFLACLVLSLYINSQTVKGLYDYPEWLWLMVPLLLYWIGRLWIITMRGAMTDDPIVYLFKDRRTYAVIFFGAVIVLLAKSTALGIPGVVE